MVTYPSPSVSDPTSMSHLPMLGMTDSKVERTHTHRQRIHLRRRLKQRMIPTRHMASSTMTICTLLKAQMPQQPTSSAAYTRRPSLVSTVRATACQAETRPLVDACGWKSSASLSPSRHAELSDGYVSAGATGKGGALFMISRDGIFFVDVAATPLMYYARARYLCGYRCGDQKRTMWQK